MDGAHHKPHRGPAQRTERPDRSRSAIARPPTSQFQSPPRRRRRGLLDWPPCPLLALRDRERHARERSQHKRCLGAPQGTADSPRLGCGRAHHQPRSPHPAAPFGRIKDRRCHGSENPRRCSRTASSAGSRSAWRWRPGQVLAPGGADRGDVARGNRAHDPHARAVRQPASRARTKPRLRIGPSRTVALTMSSCPTTGIHRRRIRSAPNGAACRQTSRGEPAHSRTPPQPDVTYGKCPGGVSCQRTPDESSVGSVETTGS